GAGVEPVKTGDRSLALVSCLLSLASCHLVERTNKGQKPRIGELRSKLLVLCCFVLYETACVAAVSSRRGRVSVWASSRPRSSAISVAIPALIADAHVTCWRKITSGGGGPGELSDCAPGAGNSAKPAIWLCTWTATAAFSALAGTV